MPACPVLVANLLVSVTTSHVPLAVLGLSGDPHKNHALAAAVRNECAVQIPDTLTGSQTGGRMRGLQSGAQAQVLSADAARAALDDAEALYQDVKPGAAAAKLEGLIQQLEADDEMTVEKGELYLRARVKAALALINGAGTKETGRAETPDGKRARMHLMRVLQINPLYRLAPKDFPPRIRLALDYAREDLAGLRSGVLDVRAAAGAAIYVEGQPQGTAPARLKLTRGEYRVWLEKDGQRSLQHRARVGDGETSLEADFEFERALNPSSASLAVPMHEVSQAFLRRVSTLLGSVSIVIVQEFRSSGQNLVGIIVYDATKKLVTRTGSISAADRNVTSITCQFASLGEGVIELDPDVPDAPLWLDDVLIGVDQRRGPFVGLSSGRHVIRMKLAGGDTDLVVPVAPNQTTMVSVDRTATNHVLRIAGVGPTPAHTPPPTSPAPIEGAGRRPPEKAAVITTADRPTASSKAWLLSAAAGSMGVAAGVFLGCLGIVVGAGGGMALAAAPRNSDGIFAALPNESATQLAVRLGFAVGAIPAGLVLMLMATAGVGSGVVATVAALIVGKR